MGSRKKLAQKNEHPAFLQPNAGRGSEVHVNRAWTAITPSAGSAMLVQLYALFASNGSIREPFTVGFAGFSMPASEKKRYLRECLALAVTFVFWPDAENICGGHVNNLLKMGDQRRGSGGG
jgi:hypothetical protein